MRQLLLPSLARYLRHFPIQRGKWRLQKTAIAWGRQVGRDLGTRTIRTKHGFQMQLRLVDWVDQHIYATGEYEPEVVTAAQAILAPGDVAVDIGANIGFFTLLFSMQVGPSGRVIALEAQPSVFERLNYNVAINPTLNIETIEVAATDREGTLSFYCGPVEHSGVGSIRNRGSEDVEIVVNAYRADSILASYNAIRLIKIDVEGAESSVIAGLTATLLRCKPDVLMEVSEHYLRESGSSAAELVSTLQELGYSMLVLCEENVVPMRNWNDRLPSQFNALFTTRQELVIKLVTEN